MVNISLIAEKYNSKNDKRTDNKKHSFTIWTDAYELHELIYYLIQKIYFEELKNESIKTKSIHLVFFSQITLSNFNNTFHDRFLPFS